MAIFIFLRERIPNNATYRVGHPLEASRVYDMTRYSSLPVLGVNYRKAVTPSRSYPAALQDTISAYAYLIREGYKRIALAGDSAGAGLGLALMQYLAQLSQESEDAKIPNLMMPHKACFYSPWADLTFSHEYRETGHFDISRFGHFRPSYSIPIVGLPHPVHPTMLHTAAASYMSNLNEYDKSAGKQDSESIKCLKNAHPYFSPALSQ